MDHLLDVAGARMKTPEIPAGPIRLELRYSIRTVPAGAETISTFEVEGSDERRQFRACGSSSVSWEEAEKDLVDGSDFSNMIRLLRIRHT